VSRFCRETLPLLRGGISGGRILRSVRAIVETDRWNSFDRFHDTTRTVRSAFEEAGAATEVYAIQTGGVPGSGRWTIHEAADVIEATADLLEPVRRRLADYHRNPWQVVQWSTSTPAEGMTCPLVILDSKEEYDRTPPGGLRGKMVLTRLGREAAFDFFKKGAAGLIYDYPVRGLPRATAWAKFSWGSIKIDEASGRLVGLSISAHEGDELRRLIKQDGPVTLHVRVNVRRYVGSHDVVSGLLVGEGEPQEEIWAIAHTAEPGAADNASGVAASIEIARALRRLISERRLPPARRTIRLLAGYECYGFFNFVENCILPRTPLAGVCVDSVGVKPSLCGRRLAWHETIPMSALFVNDLGAAIIRAALRGGNSGYRFAAAPFIATLDTLLGDPEYGFPCPYVTTGPYRGYHSSADTPDVLDPKGLAVCAAAVAAYLYFLAAAGTPEAVELATWQTRKTLLRLRAVGKKPKVEEVNYIRQQHAASLQRLGRWLGGPDRGSALAHFRECEREVGTAAKELAPRAKARKPMSRAMAALGRRVPRRKALLVPTHENLWPDVRKRIRDSGVGAAWGLFWADGKRSLAEIAEAISVETGKETSLESVAKFFDAHADIGYVEWL
jgi:hypothetical protein